MDVDSKRVGTRLEDKVIRGQLMQLPLGNGSRRLTVTMREDSGPWVDVHSALLQRMGRSRAVRRQGYHIGERRWSENHTPLMGYERDIAVAMIELMMSGG